MSEMFYSIEGKPTITLDYLDNIIAFALRNLNISNSKYRELVVRFTKRDFHTSQLGEFDHDESDNVIILKLHPKLRGVDLLHTIFHELVHAEQFLSGIYNLDNSTWKGTDYSGVDYKKRPWEVDAWNREKKLYKDFKREMKSNERS